MPFNNFGSLDDNDDSVVANLNFEVGSDGIQNLSELRRETTGLQGTMEHLTRSTSTFADYLARIPEIQRVINQYQSEHNAQLEEQNRLAAQAGQPLSNEAQALRREETITSPTPDENTAQSLLSRVISHVHGNRQPEPVDDPRSEPITPVIDPSTTPSIPSSLNSTFTETTPSQTPVDTPSPSVGESVSQYASSILGNLRDRIPNLRESLSEEMLSNENFLQGLSEGIREESNGRFQDLHSMLTEAIREGKVEDAPESELLRDLVEKTSSTREWSRPSQTEPQAAREWSRPSQTEPQAEGDKPLRVEVVNLPEESATPGVSSSGSIAERTEQRINRETVRREDGTRIDAGEGLASRLTLQPGGVETDNPNEVPVSTSSLLRQRGLLHETRTSDGHRTSTVSTSEGEIPLSELSENEGALRSTVDNLTNRINNSQSPENSDRLRDRIERGNQDLDRILSISESTTLSEGLENTREFLQGVSAGGEGSLLGSTSTQAAGLASRAAGPVGVAVAGVTAFNKVNDEYQKYRTAGQIHGGGFTEGVGYEMGIRQMAMNPFISTEQAREIMSAALNEGYTGKELDTMTEFMAKNIKDMNISVSDSVGMLKTNVEEGGQSIESLGTQLNNLKTLSRNSNTSAPQLVEQFKKGSETGVSLGASGAAAGQIGTLEGQMFQGELGKGGLQNQGADITNSLMSNQSLLAMTAQRRGRGETFFTLPSSAGAELPNEVWKTVQDNIVRQLPNNATGQYTFQQIMAEYGVNLDATQAGALFKQLKEGKNPAAEAEKRLKEQSKPKKDESSGLSKMAGGIGNTLAGGGKGLTGTLKSLRGLNDWSLATLFGNEKGKKNAFSGAKKDFRDMRSDFTESSMGDSGYDTTSLRQLVQTYGAQNLFAQDSKGKRESFETLDWGDKRKVADLISGKTKIAQKGVKGAGTLQQYLSGYDPKKADGGAGGAYSRYGTNVSGSVVIGLTPEARKLLQAPGEVGLTQGQVQANSGYNGATANSLPEGDR